MRTSKQKKILKLILDAFSLDEDKIISTIKRINAEAYIQLQFKRSLNKKNLIRRILFDLVISDDDVLKLLRIIFKKEKK